MNARLNAFWTTIVVVFTLLGLLLTINQVFFLNLLGAGMLKQQFLYYVLAVFLSLVFVVLPARLLDKRRLPWYDIVLFVVSITVNLYLAVNTENIVTQGWDYVAPTTAQIASFILWGLVLEALRRSAGLAVTIIAFIFSVYPMFAASVPIDFLRGLQSDVTTTAQVHAMGVDSILGLPLQTAAAILIGFLFFGVVLQQTGGATFFYDLAMSLLGRARGGAAKVSVVSSASMGMMSGSAVSNVLTTGPMTIPAMKRSGFDGKYAAGIEATASSGGSITPPIMGTAAFLMVSFLGIPYAEVAIAATIPALLYYLGIYTQVDAYSLKKKLRGLPSADIPRFAPTVAAGWPFLLALAGLLVLLVVVRREAQAPFQIAALLLLIALARKQDRLTFTGLRDLLVSAGKTISEIIGIIAGVGLIVGGLSMSGVSLSLARELVQLVGDNVLLILIAGALTSFILGMGMTVSAVYVFLAIVMAPALVQLGVNPVAAHLFVIYWATVSYITPPVALASFAAAGIAGESPMKTSLVAMRLGMVKYIIPFAFALNPALVAQAPLTDVVITLVMSSLGVILMACAFEGQLIVVKRRLTTVLRVGGLGAGAAMFAPELFSSLVGLALGAVIVVVAVLTQPPTDAPDDETSVDAGAPASA
ncbi:TRAP transporter permease [Ornithinimicrobium panacihumi]|uniref:TRAP transporter permease n=1 Tax=Ornithinimicrobium panacihumi TaxID=2008449 RepID=UPI003F8A4018